MKETVKVDEVFKQTGFPKYTYADRPKYELIFSNSLKQGGVHIYLYGDSKIGKTSMWKKHINSDSFIEIKITSTMALSDFYKELIDQIDPFYKSKYETANGSESELSMNGKGSLKIVEVGGDIKNTTSATENATYERAIEPIISLTSVTKKVKEVDRTVIIEDFQVANEKFVKDIADVLKAFADEQIKVIIIGIDNKIHLIQSARTDITGRINTISLEKFSNEDLNKILTKGEEVLNITFSDDVKKFLIESSLERAYILQGLCRYICSLENVDETEKKNRTIDSIENAKYACAALAKSVEGSYESTLRKIATAATNANKSDTYRWILRALRQGIRFGSEGEPAKSIGTKIQEMNPDFNVAAIYPCLKNMTQKQDVDVFKYENKRLFVNDILFIFFLKWSDELCAELNI